MAVVVALCKEKIMQDIEKVERSRAEGRSR